MGTALSDHHLAPEQIDAFRRDGFLALEGLVSSAELDELKADIVALARGRYPCPSLQPVAEGLTDAEVVEHILCLHQPHFVSPVIRRYTAHPAIAAVLGQIVGAHLREFWDGSVRCMQSMFFVKPPGKPGQAWHQDEIYIPTRDRSLCGAWIAIDDATVANGCLWVLPGSHRAGILYDQRAHDRPEEFDFAPESYGFDDSEEVAVEVPAGSVVFFNGYLLHRSRKNVSDGYRRVLVNHYCSAQTMLPWCDTADGQMVAQADCRRTHLVAGVDPRPWRGSEEPSASGVHLRHYAQRDG